MLKRGTRNKMLIRGILLLIAIVGLVWFLVPLSLSVSLNIGNVTGILVCFLLGAYAIRMPGIHRLLRNWAKHKVKRWFVRGGAMIVGVVALLLIVETGCMISAAGKEPVENSTLVVLGCRVYGERASLSMVERLDAAYEYLRENEGAVCILSGGMGSGENITEAECMYRYLVNKGIEEGRLYKEEESTSTRENLKFSLERISELGLSSEIAIVTSEYHQYRAGLIAKELGITATAVNGKTAWWLFPTYYIRELYGILYQWLF